MATIISRHPDETLALGRAWGTEAEPGWIIALSGDLGAGKTLLAKGVAEGLGCRGRITSPTFTLVHEHWDGRLPLFHLDLYRLENVAAILAAGLEEYLLASPGLTIVEWAERYYGESPPPDPVPDPAQMPSRRPLNGKAVPDSQPPTPGRLRRVWIETLGDLERRITHADSGL